MALELARAHSLDALPQVLVRPRLHRCQHAAGHRQDALANDEASGRRRDAVQVAPPVSLGRSCSALNAVGLQFAFRAPLSIDCASAGGFSTRLLRLAAMRAFSRTGKVSRHIFCAWATTPHSRSYSWKNSKSCGSGSRACSSGLLNKRGIPQPKFATKNKLGS